MAEKNLKITLVKSPIGAVPKHRATVEAMGLTKMHKTVIMPDNASTRGMIQKVGYMLKVEEAIILEEAVAMLPVTVRQQVRATRVRRHVPVLRDRALKAARCLYTDVFLREASQTETLRISLQSI